MKRKITEKIFKIIAKKKEVVEEDPDYIIISDKLKELPENKINDFYTYLVSSDKYFNDMGFMMPYHFVSAVNTYKMHLLNELWKKHNIDNKTKVLQNKIMALHDAFRHLNAQELFDFLKNKQLDKFKSKKGDLYFFKEEIDVIIEKGLIVYLGEYSSKFTFTHDLYLFIEREYKSYITKKYFYLKEKRVMKITLFNEEDKK